jgi:hypothetical protein
MLQDCESLQNCLRQANVRVLDTLRRIPLLLRKPGLQTGRNGRGMSYAKLTFRNPITRRRRELYIGALSDQERRLLDEQIQASWRDRTPGQFERRISKIRTWRRDMEALAITLSQACNCHFRGHLLLEIGK